MKNKVHPFEMSGLGLAPFRFVGVWTQPSIPDGSASTGQVEAYNLDMKSKPECCKFACAHCGTAIMVHCMIENSEGKRYAVGQDCIAKVEILLWKYLLNKQGEETQKPLMMPMSMLTTNLTNQPAPSGGHTKENMRKNFPVDEEVHNSVVAHLSDIESKGGGLPSITSWVKAACLEKIARDSQKMERKNA